MDTKEYNEQMRALDMCISLLLDARRIVMNEYDSLSEMDMLVLQEKIRAAGDHYEWYFTFDTEKERSVLAGILNRALHAAYDLENLDNERGGYDFETLEEVEVEKITQTENNTHNAIIYNIDNAFEMINEKKELLEEVEVED